MPEPRTPRRRTSLFLRLLAGIPTLLVLLLVGWAVLFFVFSPDLPDTDALFEESEQATVTVLARDGTVLARRGAEGQRFVGLEQVSPRLVEAVIATEDQRFFRHFGVDPMGLARAMVDNLRAGSVVAGGSTITQQLAKNLYLNPERNIRRKLEELMLALWLEARLTKEQILTLYLNRVYLGAGTYGVEAASQRYFGKPAANLSLPEAAMVAGLLKAPSWYAPTADLDRARQRASVVLYRMVDEGFITKEEATAARARPAKLAPEGQTDFAGHFVDWVLEGLSDHIGKPGRDLVVTTTLDRQMQLAAEKALREALAGAAERRAGEGALVLLDTSGALRAMVGGRSYRNNRFNRAVYAKRQPGSAFKPFVYLTALEAGWRPGSTVEDRPVNVKGWKPANFNDKYEGSITLARSLARSSNTAAVRLIQEVGPQEVVKTARQLGIGVPLQAVPSLALGTSEVSLLELTSAYQPLAAGGVRRAPFALLEVRDARDRTLYRHVPGEARVIPAGLAATMTDLLRGVVSEGTGKAASLGRRPAAGKTGTTQNSRDAWFVGYSGEYVAGVWIGNDDDSPMKGVSGSNLPAQVWRDVMATTPWVEPPPVVASREPERRPASRRPVPADSKEHGLGMLFNWIEKTFGGR
ncbi:penicillin-binding protein 1A [Geminicoccaceae bacterium 1502E]|nr:penicillin-binding protein 1A [Geminicoccaceae bacterium 1502E]